MTTPPQSDADGDALLERYRRASAAEPLAPSDAVRAAILAEAARLAAARAEAPTLTRFDRSALAANQWRWRLTAFGTVAAAVIAAILVLPHYRAVPPSPPAARMAASGPATGRGEAASAAAAPTVPIAPGAGGVAPPVRSLAATDTPTAKRSPGAPLPALRGEEPVAALQPRATRAEAAATGLSQAAPIAARGRTDLAASAAAPAVSGALADSSVPSVTAERAAGAAKAAAEAPAQAAGAATVAAQARARPVARDQGAALRAACKAGDPAAIAALLSAGAPLEERDSSGRTPLMVAAAQGRIAAVRLLLAHGASMEAVDRDGQSALALARRAGFDEIVAELERAARH